MPAQPLPTMATRPWVCVAILDDTYVRGVPMLLVRYLREEEVHQ